MDEPAARYVDLSRAHWAALADEPGPQLKPDDLAALASLGESVDLAEVREVYQPLARLLLQQAAARDRTHEATMRFLGANAPKGPFVVAVAGSVAAGKSTTARVLRELLARSPGAPSVALVPTDGFLFPNAELERRGIMRRKGWPESYDTRALLTFLAQVKAGLPEVTAPVYSHLTYDVLSDQVISVQRPDILLVEGLTLLQPASVGRGGLYSPVASDYFDSSVYVDAEEHLLLEWYVDRFLALRAGAFRDPQSYFRRYAELSDADARATATAVWDEINGPNLRRNILPTRGRAAVVLEKGPAHRVERVRLRLH